MLGLMGGGGGGGGGMGVPTCPFSLPKLKLHYKFKKAYPLSWESAKTETGIDIVNNANHLFVSLTSLVIFVQSL